MTRKIRVTSAECPQCGHNVMANEVGAWCPNYPCRWVLNRAKAAVSAAIAATVWGDGK